MKIGILRNEDPASSHKWEIACSKLDVKYKVIDLTSSLWNKKIIEYNPDFFVLRPPGETFRYKNLFDERLYIISQIMGYFIFPSFHEVFIYENKRMLASFLKGAQIPMPETYVFYSKQEALSFAERIPLPIVGKTIIGASGSGVTIINTQRELQKYIQKAFGKGIRRQFGPNRNTGNVKSWTKKAMASPKFFFKKIKRYLNIYADSQKGFVLLQEYVPHEFEWRIVKIGESWFGHQKVKQGEKASGTKGIDYIAPSFDLLDFCRNIAQKHNFNSMAFDILEHPTKGYVVNELQTIFGHVQDFILEVNRKIGRYLYQNNQWVFEEGDFNTNESYDLRLKTAIELYNKL